MGWLVEAVCIALIVFAFAYILTRIFRRKKGCGGCGQCSRCGEKGCLEQTKKEEERHDS